MDCVDCPRFAAPSNPDKLEQALYPPFSEILHANVQGMESCIEPFGHITDIESEFAPYIFQLFAALLEANPSGTLPPHYQSLIGPILAPPLWESKGNIPAVVRLLSCIIGRGSQYILENNQLMNTLGIFQKLLSSKANEGYGFDLLEAVIEHFPSYVDFKGFCSKRG